MIKIKNVKNEKDEEVRKWFIRLFNNEYVFNCHLPKWFLRIFDTNDIIIKIKEKDDKENKVTFKREYEDKFIDRAEEWLKNKIEMNTKEIKNYNFEITFLPSQTN